MNFQRKAWWFLPVGCLLAGALGAVSLHRFARVHWELALQEGALFSGLLCIGACAAFWLVRAYPTKVGILGYALLVGALTGAAAAWAHGLIGSWLLHDVERLGRGWWRAVTAYQRWQLYIAIMLLFTVVIALYRRMDEIEKRYGLQQDAAALLKEAELFKLRQQLQPHFLYNSLNAISSLIVTAPDQAAEMIGRLADFLRSSVKQGRSELVALEEELQYLHSYLSIESVRFGDRLQVDWQNEAADAGAKLPPFLLQPLMENAIRYGIYGSTGAVAISVHIYMQSGTLHIRISNPYDPSMRPAGGTGFGLEGVRRRLYLIYARQDLLQTAALDGQFTTTIQIPQ